MLQHEGVAASTLTPTAAVWRHIFGDGPGLVGLFSGRREPGTAELLDTQSAFFRWPGQAAPAERWIHDHAAAGRETYHCAHLLTARRRIKANAAKISTLWCDVDGADLAASPIHPTAVVASSPGRYQAYARLSRPISPTAAEGLNKRWAHAFGADTSGWDLTQLLRPPGTPNRKYPGAPIVKLVALDDRTLDPDELDRILPTLPEPAAAESNHAPRASGRIGLAAVEILEHMFRGQRGDEIRDLYTNGHGDRNPSSADLSFCNAAAFYTDRDPALMDELVRSSALMRDKWDERHAADGRTYGQMTIDKAIAHCRLSISDLARQPRREAAVLVFDAPAAIGHDGAETCITCGQPPDRIRELEAEVARLQRTLLDCGDEKERLASIVEAQQNIVTTQRAENDEHRARFQQFKKVLSNPEMSGNEKVVALVVAGEAHAPSQPLEGARVAWAKVSLQGKPEEGWIGLKEKTGLTANTISKTLERLSGGDAAPFEKQVTRDWRTRKDGSEGFVTAIQVRPLSERLSDTLRIIAAFKPDKPQHGGSEAAADAREHVRRCRKHPGATPVASAIWRCPVPSCRAILDEEPLLDHKLGDPEPTPPPVVVSRTLGHNSCDPDLVNGRTVTLDHQVGDLVFPRPPTCIGEADPDELADRRAREAASVPIRPADPHRQVGVRGASTNGHPALVFEPIPRDASVPAVPELPSLPSWWPDVDFATRARWVQEQAAAAGSVVSP